MMARVLTVLFVVILLGGCNNTPEFPTVPRIEFVKAEYWDMGLQNQDSINITIHFQDQQGDLGIYPTENFGPFASVIFFYSGDNIVTYGLRNQPGFETLPPYEEPYKCTNYIINPQLGSEVIEDTVYYVSNENHYNFLIDYMIKNQDGTFTRFPWESYLGYPDCGQSFNGRFEPDDLGIDLRKESPIEGNLTYRMLSLGFPVLLRNKVFKFRIRIKDRAFHTSNVVESPEYTLQDIKMN